MGRHLLDPKQKRTDEVVNRLELFMLVAKRFFEQFWKAVNSLMLEFFDKLDHVLLRKELLQHIDAPQLLGELIRHLRLHGLDFQVYAY
jgi:hypothetical protein